MAVTKRRMATSNDGLELDCNCKVGELIEEYNLTNINDDLVTRWTGRRGEEESVRTLAHHFNCQLLRSEMRAVNMELVEGRVENLHELLTDDDRLDAVQMEARSTLDGAGIDVDRLEDRFLSHQTMYRHLKNCLDAEKQRNILTVDKERDRIHSVQNRAEVIVDDSVSRLRNGDKLDLDEFEVLINFRVTCENCGALHDVTNLIDAGGCECQR